MRIARRGVAQLPDMDTESLHARIEHETAELRALHPYVRDCHAALVRWSDADGVHHSLHLDVRWPQHQTLVGGEPRSDAAAAIEAGFRAARQRVHEAVQVTR